MIQFRWMTRHYKPFRWHWISPRVLMAVEDAVTVEPVGEFELKGIRRPIAAYNVVAALPPSP